MWKIPAHRPEQHYCRDHHQGAAAVSIPAAVVCHIILWDKIKRAPRGALERNAAFSRYLSSDTTRA
jgi:hypothetical protein